MYSFEVHSNESACRKSGCLGLEQVICEFEKGEKRVILLCKLGIGRRIWSSVSFPGAFGGGKKGQWFWIFGFTMFGFGEKIEPHFWWHGWYPEPRHCCWWRKLPLPRENYIWCSTTLRWLYLDIRRNYFPEAIRHFTQYLFSSQKLFSWGGNEDEKVGAKFYFIYCWLSKIGINTWN